MFGTGLTPKIAAATLLLHLIYGTTFGLGLDGRRTPSASPRLAPLAETRHQHTQQLPYEPPRHQVQLVHGPLTWACCEFPSPGDVEHAYPVGDLRPRTALRRTAVGLVGV